ncbi:MAG: peptidoglycan editing factor PgeF [Legionella sp.]|nr:peptidoglycan editing factor PgeF [Legionella sp.]
MYLPYYLKPNWPAPANIQALTVTYPENFSEIKQDLDLPAEPIWLKQTHSNIAAYPEPNVLQEADACVSNNKLHPLAIKTADCLPVLLCNQAGTEIAAIHGGWRSLLSGIIENTLLKLKSNPQQLMAWTGPAICKNCFEVGPEVRDAFIQKYPDTHTAFNQAQAANKYFGNLAYIAELILKNNNLNNIYHANACTFEEENKFYSYRRAKQTGRIISLIWFQ